MRFMIILQVTSLLWHIVLGSIVPSRIMDVNVATASTVYEPNEHEHNHDYDGDVDVDVAIKFHPAVVTKPRLIERYDKRYPDGRYEYRYVLSDGDTRYERSYWTQAEANAESKLARIGFYSYPLMSGEYLTVFYTSDANGYHVDSARYTRLPPSLPQTLDVPATR